MVLLSDRDRPRGQAAVRIGVPTLTMPASRPMKAVRSASLLPVGRSVQGREISAFLRPATKAAETALIFGGFHGDEPKSVQVCRHLMTLLDAEPSTGSDRNWVIVPVVNPDGLAGKKRRNARGVDLNRNFPTRNWTLGDRRSRMFGGESPGSEPEAQIVAQIVSTLRPAWIITIHSIGRGRHCNNYDGPARRLAGAMKKFNGYPVRETIGYPTPGSFGTWAGRELGIPTVTLELPSLHSAKRCWEDNRDALLHARP